jgi:acetylornithine deacetylase/succinyl-diaminopimelate desuccinylase-like protein
LILALTADEEGGSFNGVDWLVKNQRGLIDAALALNEGGSGQMKNGKYLVNQVGASEKVYQDFKLESKNPGGHSSRPTRDNAIYHLSDGLGRLEKFDFPVHLNEVTRAYFDRMAQFQSDASLAADMRAVARQPANTQAVDRLAAASPYYNALMRTTCVATMLSGGHATNALPQLATANVNCRILPGEEPSAIKAKLVQVLADPKIDIAFVDEAKPSPPSPLQPEIMKPIESITKAMWPGVSVVPTMGTGATDMAFLREKGMQCYGIGPATDEEDGPKGFGPHSDQERILEAELYRFVRFNIDVATALAGAAR